MIRAVTRADLADCLEVIRQGYETVAVEFGLTDENCPDRGRASLPIKKHAESYDSGTIMYCYLLDGRIIGFLGMRLLDENTCGLDDIVVLPEFRQQGYGKELLDFCKQEAKRLGARKIRLGMIDDNKRLRNWYEDNGFINVEYKHYEGAPFTVGKMECTL